MMSSFTCPLMANRSAHNPSSNVSTWDDLLFELSEDASLFEAGQLSELDFVSYNSGVGHDQKSLGFHHHEDAPAISSFDPPDFFRTYSASTSSSLDTIPAEITSSNPDVRWTHVLDDLYQEHQDFNDVFTHSLLDAPDLENFNAEGWAELCQSTDAQSILNDKCPDFHDSHVTSTIVPSKSIRGTGPLRRTSSASPTTTSQLPHRTERRYRANINNKIAELRELVTPMLKETNGSSSSGTSSSHSLAGIEEPMSKGGGRGIRPGTVSKAAVLESAINYIQTLESRHADKKQRIELLKSRLKASLDALNGSRDLRGASLLHGGDLDSLVCVSP